MSVDLETATPESQYRIAWRSKITGWTSGGVPCMSKQDAAAERDRLNERWPMLEHWIEPETKS